MQPTRFVVALSVLGLSLASPAFAKHHSSSRHHHHVRAHHHHVTRHYASAPRIITCDVRGCSDSREELGKRADRQLVRFSRLAVRGALHSAYRVVESIPALCDHGIVRRLWCGCGTARKLGLSNSDGHLNLASNYGRYFVQRSAPCAPCAAWRSGHVVAIVSGHPGAWRVYDPNGGPRDHRGIRQAIEYTASSLRGYRFADTSAPRRWRSAEL